MKLRIICILATLFFFHAMYTVTIAKEEEVDLPTQQLSEDVIATPMNDVFLGVVHVLRKEKGSIDCLSFSPTANPGQPKPQPLILVFNSKEREQTATKLAEKAPVYLEGKLGFSGQRQFLYVNSILRKE